jgi:hypothetical protein
MYTDESSSGTNLTHNLVFDVGGWGLHLHCGQQHSVVNNIFAGNAAQLPTPGARAHYADYGLEPFCNFEFHNTSVQGAQLERNIFDQRVTSAAGVGRAVSVFNNQSSSLPSIYGNISNTLINMSFAKNIFSCVDSNHSQHVSAKAGGGGNKGGCWSDFPGAQSFEEWQKTG